MGDPGLPAGRNRHSEDVGCVSEAQRTRLADGEPRGRVRCASLTQPTKYAAFPGFQMRQNYVDNLAPDYGKTDSTQLA